MASRRFTLHSHFAIPILVGLLAAGFVRPATAANITWIGGDGTWSDGAANNANWSPADEPDADDAAIFNTANSIDLGSNNTINGLTMSTSADVFLNDNDLTVNGATTIGAAGTVLNVEGSAAAFTGQNVTLNSGGTLFVDGGAATLSIAGITNAALIVNSGGTLSGNGSITMADVPFAITTLVNNNGSLTASNPSSVIITPPAAATLSINASSANARIDLDGALETGILNVQRNQTLDINIPLADSFNGDINFGHNTKLDISTAWTMAGGTIDVNNGAVAGFPATPRGTATIAGPDFRQTGGTITVEDTDGTLQFDADFILEGGSLVNNGHVIFNSNAAVGAAANFTMPGAASSLTVKADAQVFVVQMNFNLDGNGTATNVVTIESGGSLSVDLGAAGDQDLTGVINLQGGKLLLDTTDNTWAIDGAVNVTAGLQGSEIAGDVVTFGGADVTLDADSLLTVNTMSTWGPAAVVTVGAGARLKLRTATFNGPTITGAGELEMEDGSLIASNTTIAAAHFDWDGPDLFGTHTIQSGNTLTINSPTFDDDGDMDDNFTIGGNGGALVMNGPLSWFMRGTLTTGAILGASTIGGSSRMILSSATGVMNVNGLTNLAAGVDFSASSTTTIGAAFTLNLQNAGFGFPNAISGGTINGPGTLAAETGCGLRGFGTINAPINFNGSARLIVANGLLDVNGPINDVGRIEIEGGAAVLDLAAALSTAVTDDGISMAGGTLQGAAITIASQTEALRGHGTVTNALINNGLIRAQQGTLVLDNAASNYHGSGGTGQLSVLSGAVLEIRDTAQFNFTGTATVAGGGALFANGFGLNLEPGSTINLTAATYESTKGADIGGTVTVNSGADSTIKVENNFFLTLETGSATTLTGNLQLVNNNIHIEAGATFSGTGALVVPDGSHMVANAGADIDVLLDMQGAFRLANSDGIGRVDLADYQHSRRAGGRGRARAYRRRTRRRCYRGRNFPVPEPSTAPAAGIE